MLLSPNVIRLAAAQALAGANASVFYATGAIVGSMLAPSPALATLPITLFVVGMAAGTLPNGWLSRRYGRVPAFIAGTSCGAAAGLIAALAILAGSFPLFCLAAFCGGLYGAVVQSLRFAAADGTSAEERPRALSWVMAGGLFAGVLGPQLVTWTMGFWPPYTFAASYFAQALVALVAMAVLAGVDLPRPRESTQSGGRPLAAIVRQPNFLIAAVCGVASYTIMNLVMTSAPLAMNLCGLPVSASNLTIQWHIVAMYGPSFFTGPLIARYGARSIVAAGFVITIAAALTGLSGITEGHFSLALILLGIGWNFSFVGASALVLESHRPEEKNKVQAFNDFLIFGTMAAGSFSSGQLLASYGWQAVNMVVFPPLTLALAALLLFGRVRRERLA